MQHRPYTLHTRPRRRRWLRNSYRSRHCKHECNLCSDRRSSLRQRRSQNSDRRFDKMRDCYTRSCCTGRRLNLRQYRRSAIRFASRNVCRSQCNHGRTSTEPHTRLFRFRVRCKSLWGHPLWRILQLRCTHARSHRVDRRAIPMGSSQCSACRLQRPMLSICNSSHRRVGRPLHKPRHCRSYGFHTICICLVRRTHCHFRSWRRHFWAAARRYQECMSSYSSRLARPCSRSRLGIGRTFRSHRRVRCCSLRQPS